MGINIFEVRLLVGVCLLLQVCCAAHPCPSNHQYWSTELESCVNCSKCNTREKPLVIRPCQGHVDTECGVLSDFNIDWSWLTKNYSKKHSNFEKPHHKHSFSEENEDDNSNVEKKKHHGKKAHKHHVTLDDQDYFADNIDKKHHSGERKHHTHLQGGIKINDKYHDHKMHHFDSDESDESHENKHHGKRIGDDNILDDFEELKHTGRKEDLERWLQVSKSRLQHRKEDLIKNLREEGHLEKKKHAEHIKLTPEIRIVDESKEQQDNLEELIDDRFLPRKHSPTRKPLPNMDLKLFEELVNQEHKRQKGTTIDLLKLMKSGEGPNGISPNLQHFKKHHKADNAFADSFDYRSVVPTHRLVLGEPSTISEIMDQGFSDDGEDENFGKTSSKFKIMPWEESITMEEKEPKMSPVEFTAAEQFFWDWQAVALTSAVAACLLFFVVVILYSVCQARKWKKLIKNSQYEPSAIDLEEMLARTSLMHPITSNSTVVDTSMPNHYLENLLAAKEQHEKKSNIYTPKPRFS